MSESSDYDRDLARAQSAAEALGEHFDTVQIFATRHEPGIENGTIRFQVGVGNFFARYGQVRHWLLLEDEATRAIARDDGPSR